MASQYYKRVYKRVAMAFGWFTENYPKLSSQFNQSWPKPAELNQVFPFKACTSSLTESFSMSPVRDATSTSTPTGWPGHTSASSRSYPPGGATSWGPRWWGFLSSYLGTHWWQRIDNWKQNKSYVESNEKCVVVNWDFIIGFLFKSNFYWTPSLKLGICFIF